MKPKKTAIRIVKLINGDDIICNVIGDQPSKGVVTVEYPMTISYGLPTVFFESEEEADEYVEELEEEEEDYIELRPQSNLELRPWIPFTTQSSVNIPTKHILTVARPSYSLLLIYMQSTTLIHAQNKATEKEVEMIKDIESTLEDMNDITVGAKKDTANGEIDQWIKSLKLDGIILKCGS